MKTKLIGSSLSSPTPLPPPSRNAFPLEPQATEELRSSTLRFTTVAALALPPLVRHSNNYTLISLYVSLVSTPLPKNESSVYESRSEMNFGFPEFYIAIFVGSLVLLKR